MTETSALAALSALAHPTRLAVFRLLVEAGPDGMAAGAIADAMDSRLNTMSKNLSVLTDAGLLVNHREGRSIVYEARIETMRELLDYLMQDCCGGSPELCAPLFDGIRKGC